MSEIDFFEIDIMKYLAKKREENMKFVIFSFVNKNIKNMFNVLFQIASQLEDLNHTKCRGEAPRKKAVINFFHFNNLAMEFLAYNT